MTRSTWQSTPAGREFLRRHGDKKRVCITWLARARILSGQTVAQAASACGLNKRSWEGWEKGKCPSAPVVLHLLSRFPPGSLPVRAFGPATFVTVTPQTLEPV